MKFIFLSIFFPCATFADNNWPMLGYNPQRTSRVDTNTETVPNDPIVHCFYETTHANEKFYTSPAIVDGTIFISSLITNIPLFFPKIPRERSEHSPFRWWGDGYVYSIDAETCQLNWEFNTGSWVESSLLVQDGVIYVGNGNGSFFALEASTGNLIWRYDSEPASLLCRALGFLSFASYALLCDTRSFNSSPLVLNGRVFFGSRDGHLNIIDTTTGEMVKRTPVNGDMHGALAMSLDAQRFYGATAATEGSNVYAFDSSTGDILWEAELGQIYCLSPAVDEMDRVFWPTMEGLFAGYNGTTGEELWNVDINQPSRSSVSVGPDGNLYLAGFSTNLTALNPNNGDIEWRAPLNSFSEGATVASDALVLGDYAGFLSKIAFDGSVIWTYCPNECNANRPTRVAIQGMPTINTGRVYFGSYDGNVYVVKEAE